MRPRRHIFHHHDPPPPPPAYQSVSNNAHQASSALQPMAPPPIPVGGGGGTAPGQSTTPPMLSQPDLIAELIRLGLNTKDMMANKQSAGSSRQHHPQHHPQPPQGQEEVMKNLQAILGKKDIAELLQKLQPANDWAAAPPDYSRLGGSGGGNPGNRDSVIRGPNSMFLTTGSGASGSGGGARGGPVSFTNNITNNGNSSQQEQDIQYASSTQQQHQATASAINHHHQQFRIPTTANSTTPTSSSLSSSSTAMQNSPFMRNQQSLSQHNKSVLSLHHHQQQQQQNDPTHRHRSSHHHQQHKLNATPNSSFANLSDLSGIGGGGGGPSTSTTTTATAGPGSTTLEAGNSSSIFSHTNKTSPALSSYTIASGSGGSGGGGGGGSGVVSPRAPSNLMDALSGGASTANASSGANGPQQLGIDINMHDTSPFQLSGSIIDKRDNMKQKSVSRHHQQLRGQLKAAAVASNNDKLKNYPWPNQQNVPSSSLPHHGTISGNGDPNQAPNQHSRTINSNNQTINNTVGPMSQIQRQLTSPLASAISPPQATPAALSSVPKSLLNLAACSTSPPASNNITANNRMTSQLQAGRGATNVNQTFNPVGGDASASNNRQPQQQQQNQQSQLTARITGNASGSLIQKTNQASTGGDSTNQLQQMIARSSNSNKLSNANATPATRTNYSNFSLSSLLSDDQSSSSLARNVNNSNNNIRTINSGQNFNANSRPQNPTNLSTPRSRPPSARSEDVIVTANNPEARKDTYLAYLQERAAKAGISIGEIAGPSHGQALDMASNSLMDQNRALLNQQQQQTSGFSTNEVFARKEIESAISQVENRNDLSLLYPPISLSSSSQKQVNYLSAGLEPSKDANIFTDELKKIVQEGCNIIYECKTCSNLFRSLANLVKHKRNFCRDQNNETAQFELKRRTDISALQSVDLSVTKSHQNSAPSRNPLPIDSGPSGPGHTSTRTSQPETIQQQQQQQQQQPTPSLGSQKYNLRGKRVDVSFLTGDSRGPRQAPKGAHQDARYKDSRGNLGTSRDSQQQPENPERQTNLSRLLQTQPRSRVPQMKDSALMDALSVSPASSTRPNNMSDLYQDHVRNSSLAKTLLSESVKTMTIDPSNPIVNNNLQTSRRPPAPKRKALEDCIRKVKRDKLGPDDEQGASGRTTRSVQESDQLRDPLDMDDSSTDHDALVIDLDGSPYHASHQSRRKQNRSHTRASSSMNSLNSQSSTKLNSSSALLKALTRPVESRPNYNTSSAVQKLAERTSLVSQQVKPAEEQESSPSKPSPNIVTDESDVRSTELETSKDDIPPRSPILDNFTCDSCEMDLGDHSALFEHVLSKHRTTKKIYPCIFCSLSFITLENVCRHIIDIHKKSKVQVGRLKDVVQSRSFMSDDFANCDDIPAGFKNSSRPESTASDYQKDQQTTKSRLTPEDALSDLAATQQILNDTVALVSMAASPTKSTSPTKKTPTLGTRSSSRLAGEEPSPGLPKEEPSGQGLTNDTPKEKAVQDAGSPTSGDDMLSDSMIPSISDEQLAILEREEAEIEAERLRKEEAKSNEETQTLETQTASENSAVPPSRDCTDEKDELLVAPRPPPSSSQRSDVDHDLSNQETASSYDSQTWHEEYERDQKHRGAGKGFGADEPSSSQDDETELSGSKADEESEDTQSTQAPSHQGRVSRGKQMVPPARQASDYDEDDEEEDDDENDNDDDEDEGDDDDDYNNNDGDERQDVNDIGSDNENTFDDNWSSTHAAYPQNHLRSLSGSSQDGSEEDEDDDQDGSDNDCDEVDDDDEGGFIGTDMGDSYSSKQVKHPTPRRRSSHGSSTRGETDLIPSENNHEHEDEHGSSRASSRTPASATAESKSKPSGASSASSSSGGAGGATPSSSSGGGIMKLKIQLKKQPDEKSKVYRIVE